MNRYADPERCPDCRGPITFGAPHCPSCGLCLEGPLAARLFTTLTTADDLLAQIRAAADTSVTAPAARLSSVVSPGDQAPGDRAPGDRAPGDQAPGGFPAVLRQEDRPAGRRRAGISTASVPVILLGLGALCLLVAALVFVAVAWSGMGIGGRTATLLGLTVVAGALTWWAARRRLRAATESVGAVTFGLLVLDLIGAREAGWLGAPTTTDFLVLLGGTLVATGVPATLVVRRTPAGALVAGEVVAAIGLATAASATLEAAWLPPSTAQTSVVAVLWAAGFAAHVVRLRVLTLGAALLGGLAWLSLAVTSTERALENASLRELWLDLEVWPLLASGILVGLLTLPGRLPLDARRSALSIASLVGVGVLLAPFADGPWTDATVAGAVLLVALGAGAWLVPQRWRPVLGAPVAVLGAWMAASAYAVIAGSVTRLLAAGAATWDGAPGAVLPAAASAHSLAAWTLPVTVLAFATALVALARSFSQADRLLSPLAAIDVLAAAGAGAVVLTVAAYPVPLWVVLLLLVTTAAGFITRALRCGDALPLALGAGFLALGAVASLHAEWLTLPVLAAALGGTLVVHLRWPHLEVAMAAGTLGAMSAAGLAWTLGTVFGTPAQWTALAGVAALALMVLSMPYVDPRLRANGPPSYARLGLETGALLSAVALSGAGVALATSTNAATWTAVYLTVVGAATSATALLRPDRRAAGWLGGALLAAATWVRLADIGVDSPEAYTLPSALALLAVGVLHVRGDRDARTATALTPGLLLALLPSLLWVLVDPVALRAVLLGLACLVLVLAGIRLRWSAPVVHGALVGTILVLRLATPVTEAVPRWALIGAAGALLVALGITWEQRLREARAIVGYVHRLR